jgi:hypothetical protein
MVITRARTGGAPSPPPAPTKAQKAEMAEINKAQNAKIKAQRTAAKAIKDEEKVAAKAARDQQKAAAKAVRDHQKAAAQAEKEKAKAEVKAAKQKEKGTAKAPKPKMNKRAPAIAKARRKNVIKAANAPASKKGRSAKAPPKPADSESDESDEKEVEEDEKEPGHKRRRIESRSSQAYVEIKVRRSAHGNKTSSLPEIICIDMKEWNYSKVLPFPEDLETKIQSTLPIINVGGSAPQPRWLVTQCKSMPQLPLQYSNIGSMRRSSLSASSSDYGRLIWYLDGGNFKLWCGLEYPQLEELAFKCFEHSLEDATLKAEIHDSLSNGPLPELITSVEGWYPTLPPQPHTRYFGKTSSGLPLWDSPPNSNDMGYYYKDYERPSLAVQPPRSVLRSHQHILATKMLDQIGIQSSTSTNVSTADPGLEQTQDLVSPHALGDQERASRVGEYKCV